MSEEILIAKFTSSDSSPIMTDKNPFKYNFSLFSEIPAETCDNINSATIKKEVFFIF